MLVTTKPPFTASVRRDARAGTVLTGPARNVRATESVSPQAAPDPPRDGSIPSRPARQQIATFFNWQFWTPDDFLAAPDVFGFGPGPATSYPRGVSQPFGIRPNIQRPPAQAYGSLFELDSPIYGVE